MDKPIIGSLLDLDKYKLTMAQIVHDLYPNKHVKYSFINRTMDIKLAYFIDMDELVEQINHIKALRFSYDDLTYLKSQPEFKPEFINYLAKMNYDTQFTFKLHENKLNLEFEGSWDNAIIYETMVIGIVNELFGRSVLKGLTDDSIKDLKDKAIAKLIYKLTQFKKYTGIKFVDFGTRRRHSGDWQKQILEICKTEAPNNLVGTSNYLMAKELDLKPIGTMAHELFMVKAAMDYSESSHTLRQSQLKTINEWVDYYGEPLSIILTDTFGTNAFLEDFGSILTEKCVGVRQDSGNPVDFGIKMINHYKKMGVNPKEKLIVFSDGLDENKIIELYLKFKDRIKVSFGWGTSLTNDLGIKPLSLVVKATEVNGEATVKLSDNVNKAIGPIAHIEIYKDIFKPTQTKIETIY